MIVDPKYGTWLTVQEAAHHHGVTTKTIYAWINRHQLPTFRIHGIIHLRDLDLAACEKARRDTPQFKSRSQPRRV